MGNTFNLALLFIFHFSLSTFSMELSTTNTDQLALLELKRHVTHDPHNVLASNWSGSTPVCIWFGVSCGSKHHRVTALSLTGLGLVGTLPPHLGNLSFLSLLRITNNSFHGRIPVQLSNLRRLEYLSFANNQFNGEIPSWLGSLTQLRKLFLYQNSFKGVIPISLANLTKLEILTFFTNQISGEIPKQIANFTLLTAFDCSYNKFTGTIPHQIGNLKYLEYLHLGANNIGGAIPPAIFNISTLLSISLTSNQLNGHLPPNMGLWLPNIKILYLAINRLVGSFPVSISNASQLTSLDMSDNYISGSIPDTLGNLRNLKLLNLEINNLSSLGMSFLSSLTNCRGLEMLSFENNPLINGTLDGLVGNLSDSLQGFYASECNIRGTIPDEFGNLSRLITISLDSNRLTGQIPTTIGRLKELQRLSIDGNKLEGSIPSEVCHLNKLSFLHLESNKLSGPIPSCSGNLISMRELFLSSNSFSSIPSTLIGLKDLLTLNLSSNSISGPLPTDIGKLKVLTSMDFSNNQFSGDIPTGVADLKDLTYFSLSNNRITGSIPDSFGDDSLSLEFLDLSRNNLTGEIPKSLQKLRYLKYFNVSFNRLQGEIPEGGSLGNYSMESFEGNEALCGAPRLHVPKCITRPLGNSKARTSKLITYFYVAVPISATILVVALIIIFLQKRKRRDKLPTQQDLLPLGTWRRISYHELHQGTDGFNESRLLGNGSYGAVYKGILSDGMEFAVKVFKLELDRAFKSFDVECEILRNTRHRNLIKIISSCSNNLDFKALVLEFMPNGSLDNWLHSNNHFLDILQRLNIMIDVASALEYLHHCNETPVVHCDLKPSNILLDEDMVAHLSDFGIAKLVCEEDSMIQTMTIATVGYMAPEYGIEGIVSTKGDVYSFGILMMEAITGKKPTDEMFVEERSLKNWVKESVTSPLNQVVDANLLSTTGRQLLATNNCALSILQVGLECSVELPDERLDMREIVTKLKKIKVKFLKDIERVR